MYILCVVVCLFTCVYCKCIIGHVVCVQVHVCMLHQCSVCVLVIEYNYTSGHESALIYYLLSFGSGCMGAAASVFYRIEAGIFAT